MKSLGSNLVAALLSPGATLLKLILRDDPPASTVAANDHRPRGPNL